MAHELEQHVEHVLRDPRKVDLVALVNPTEHVLGPPSARAQHGEADVPAVYGSWSAACALFRRWQRAGVWQRVLTALQAVADAAGQVTWDVSVDSTIARTHQQTEPPGGITTAEGGDVDALPTLTDVSGALELLVFLVRTLVTASCANHLEDPDDAEAREEFDQVLANLAEARSDVRGIARGWI